MLSFVTPGAGSVNLKSWWEGELQATCGGFY